MITVDFTNVDVRGCLKSLVVIAPIHRGDPVVCMHNGIPAQACLREAAPAKAGPE